MGQNANNWYAAFDIAKLGPGSQNDLIRYGKDLIVNTPRHIGKNATDPAMRYAGNDLACQNCHLNAGLQPFAAPFVSTFATFPMMVDDQVLTLTDRHQRLHAAEHERQGLAAAKAARWRRSIAYLKFVGQGHARRRALPGMGLQADRATRPRRPTRGVGEEVYAKVARHCHKEDGQGELKRSPGIGYSIPPLWGDASFNAGAGMAKTAYAASYIRDNMPFGINYLMPVLTVQQAWDVAAFMISKPHPPATVATGSDLD